MLFQAQRLTLSCFYASNTWKQRWNYSVFLEKHQKILLLVKSTTRKEDFRFLDCSNTSKEHSKPLSREADYATIIKVCFSAPKPQLLLWYCKIVKKGHFFKITREWNSKTLFSVFLTPGRMEIAKRIFGIWLGRANRKPMVREEKFGGKKRWKKSDFIKNFF